MGDGFNFSFVVSCVVLFLAVLVSFWSGSVLIDRYGGEYSQNYSGDFVNITVSESDVRGYYVENGLDGQYGEFMGNNPMACVMKNHSWMDFLCFVPWLLVGVIFLFLALVFFVVYDLRTGLGDDLVEKLNKGDGDGDGE